MKKATKKKHKDLAKKRRDIFFKKKCQARKRVKMRRVDRERVNIRRGTHKERKHEKCQNKEKKERET